MLGLSEINRSLRGAVQLFFGRKEGLQAMDRSVEGFWRSFAVIFILLPINAIVVFAIARSSTSGADFRGLFMEQLPLLILDWVAFPVALAMAAGPLGVSAKYVSYVVARNWSAPVAGGILAIPYILQGAGWIPVNGAALLSLIAIIVVLRYGYVVLRLALGTTMAVSAGLVVADLALTLVLIAIFG